MRHIVDRKDLLLTVRQILKDFATNRHVFTDEEDEESLQSYARKLVMKLLIDNKDNDQKRKNAKNHKNIVYSEGCISDILSGKFSVHFI